MLQRIRKVFKRMNLDVDAMMSKPDEYSYLKNGSQFESEGDGAIRSVLGNRLIENSDLGGGTNKVIGRYEDTHNNRVIYFLYNSTGNHAIYVLSDDNMVGPKPATIRLVFKWSGLNFSLDYLITGVVVYGDILIWCDGANNQIRKINITTGLGGGYPTPVEKDITLIKAPPVLPLLIAPIVDSGYANNYIKDNSFQFYYRYYYGDNEVSVWSATSKTLLHSRNALINKINVTIDTTNDPIPAQVTKIDLAFRLASTNEFVIFRTLIASEFTATTAFYNDTVGATVPDTESFKWNDSVPLRAEALEMIKNRLFFFNYLENYTKTRFTFSVTKVAPIYTNQTIYVNGAGTEWWWLNPDGSYYRVDFDGPSDTAISPASYGYAGDIRSDAAPGGTSLTSSTATVKGHFGIRVFKGGSKYKAGIMFFDTWGRQIGVYTNGESLSFDSILAPPLDQSPGYAPALGTAYTNWMKWDFTALSNTVIPTWAASYAVVRTKALDKSFFIQDITADVYYYGTAADGTIVYSKGLAGSKSLGVAIDISNLTRNKIGYTFNKGDKITMQFPSGLRTFNIFSQDGKFVNILEGDEFAALITLSTTAPTDNIPYEIFTPAKAQDLYYEVGEKYLITNPGAGGRAFSTLVGYLQGDVKIIVRRQYRYNNAAYSATLPYDNVLLEPGVARAVEAMNPCDQFFDEWAQDTGRPISELPYIIPQQKQNHLRWSGVYVQDSLINALSTFDAFDEYTLPKENGAGVALKKNDRVLVAMHQKEVSAVYIGEGFVNTSDANRFLAKTENVVGADNKYIGGFGTRNPESVIVYADRTYFYDANKVAFVRRAPDGLVAISDYGVRNFIKKEQLEFPNQFALPGNLRVFGGYDPKLELCLWSFVYTDVKQFTIAFHEPTNTWIGFFDYDVEQYSRINGILVSFKDGEVWKHDNPIRNNFNGVQYPRLLEFNYGGQKVNVWKNIALDADEIYNPQGSWVSRPSAADNNWVSVAYGNGVFVAVSIDGTAMSSTDGLVWTLRTTPAALVWNSVTWGNGTFVAVASSGSGNRVMTSPDGITWTSRSSAADNGWLGVTYGNGLFVAVAGSGSGNRVMTSPDGITWTIRVSAADNTWQSVTYGQGLYVAVAGSGAGDRVMTSPNGISWTIRSSAANNNWQSVTYGNGLFVAVAGSGVGNRVMTSSDGMGWTIGISAADNGWASVTYGYGLFVAVAISGSGNRVMASSDGITWATQVSAADNVWSGIVYGNNILVAVSTDGGANHVMTSGLPANDSVVTLTDNGPGYIFTGSGQQLTTVKYLDFVNREGVFRSAIFRNINNRLDYFLFNMLPPSSWTDTGNGMSNFVKTLTTFSKAASGVFQTMGAWQPISPSIPHGSRITFKITVVVSGTFNPGIFYVLFQFFNGDSFAGGSQSCTAASFSQLTPGEYSFLVDVTLTDDILTRLYIEAGVPVTPSAGAVEITIAPWDTETITKYEGSPMRSQILKTQITCNRTDAAALRAVEIGFTPSEVS